MRRRAFLLLTLVAALGLCGCPAIPKNAAALTAKVSEGILRNQAETERIIHTLAEVERGVLDDRWEEIYQSTETAYRKKKGMTSDAALSFDDRLNVATNAAAVRDGILKEISDIEANLISQSRANSQKVVEMNEEVHRYLLSLQSLQEANDDLSRKLQEITGVDVSGLVGKTRRAIEEKIGKLP
jgi:hypothetical protein